MTHDDGVELTFDNIVNDSNLYGSDMKKSIRFRKSNRNTFYLNRNALVL